MNGVRDPQHYSFPSRDHFESQEALLTVNNAFEGQVFVSPTFTAEQTLTQYVELLFPNFNSELVNATVAQYAGLHDGDVTLQANDVMGDCVYHALNMSALY